MPSATTKPATHSTIKAGATSVRPRPTSVTPHAIGIARFLNLANSGPTKRPAAIPATVITVEARPASTVPPKPRPTTSSETLELKSWNVSTNTKLMSVIIATSLGILANTLTLRLGSR